MNGVQLLLILFGSAFVAGILREWIKPSKPSSKP